VDWQQADGVTDAAAQGKAEGRGDQPLLVERTQPARAVTQAPSLGELAHAAALVVGRDPLHGVAGSS